MGDLNLNVTFSHVFCVYLSNISVCIRPLAASNHAVRDTTAQQSDSEVCSSGLLNCVASMLPNILVVLTELSGKNGIPTRMYLGWLPEP